MENKSRKTCKECEHFRQHYVLDAQRGTPVNCGHCVYPGIKHRRPDTSACRYFVQCTGKDLPNRDEVVSFLTTDFLKEILKMGLPPELGDG